MLAGRFWVQASVSWKTRLSTPLPATEPADLSELVRQLRREVLELRQEVAELRRENAELRQQVGYWKAQHARAVHRAEHLEAEVEQLRGENRKLQDQLFGRKSETASTRDRSNRLEGEEDQAPSTPPQAGPAEGSARSETAGLQPLARGRGSPRVARRPACVARSAARRSRPATPRIPNRSRSRSEPIADASDGDVTSGRAPARTVREPSPLPPRPS